MRILSIGNSFSDDSHRYLHKLAISDGEDLNTVNLYISGCPLSTHYSNVLEDKAAYAVRFNGEDTGLFMSIKQALISGDWDIITLQQASINSAKKETYFPYIEYLVDYVKNFCPNAKIYIHQTWAYEDGSEKLASCGYSTATEMFNDIQKTYKSVANSINADGIIPCGQAMLNAINGGIGKIHRDTFHASLGAGRYLLALTWYKTLTGKDIIKNNFSDFDEPVSQKEREIVIEAVNKAFKK